jgi:hypothetical protein
LKSFYLFLIPLLLLISCTKKDTVYTVSWFKEHSAERTAVLAKCNDNPGEARNIPNCINAARAAASNFYSDRVSNPKPLTFQ